MKWMKFSKFDGAIDQLILVVNCGLRGTWASFKLERYCRIQTKIGIEHG